MTNWRNFRYNVKHIALPMLFAAWVSVAFVVLYALYLDSLKTFDPKGELYKSTQDKHFEQQLTQVLESIVGDVSNTLIHFTQPSCWCETVAQEHIESVRQLALSEQLNYQVVDVSTQPTFRLSLLPSTPAVAVFSSTGALKYFGPYSSGLYCSAGNGLVEPYVSQSSLPSFATLVVNSDGCYCQRTQ